MFGHELQTMDLDTMFNPYEKTKPYETHPCEAFLTGLFWEVGPEKTILAALGN